MALVGLPVQYARHWSVCSGQPVLLPLVIKPFSLLMPKSCCAVGPSHVPLYVDWALQAHVCDLPGLIYMLHGIVCSVLVGSFVVVHTQCSIRFAFVHFALCICIRCYYVWLT